MELCRRRSWGRQGQGCTVRPVAKWGLGGTPASSHTPAWTEQSRAGWLLLSRSLTRPICCAQIRGRKCSSESRSQKTHFLSHCVTPPRLAVPLNWQCAASLITFLEDTQNGPQTFAYQLLKLPIPAPRALEAQGCPGRLEITAHTGRGGRCNVQSTVNGLCCLSSLRGPLWRRDYLPPRQTQARLSPSVL